MSDGARPNSTGTVKAGATAEDYEHCRLIMRHYATSYYFATRFFPPDIRQSVYALYAFVRMPDQWVDCPEQTAPEVLCAQIDAYERDLIKAVLGEVVESPVLRAFGECIRKHRIPLRYCADFLDAMRMDLVRTRYTTLNDLQTYIWGSACVVGLMMLCLLDAPRAHEPPLTADAFAEALFSHRLALAQPGTPSNSAHSVAYCAALMGLAMQMTNFLRDVGEDYAIRGRIYLPQEELEAFSVSEAQIAEGVVDERWRAFMQFQIARCREWYQQAERGISLLPPAVQYPVLLGGRLYARILDAIERNGYDVFRQRARTTPTEKARLAMETYLLWRRA